MKYKILLVLTLFTSIGSIHSVPRAILDKITDSFAGDPSPEKLQALCTALKSQNLDELTDTYQGEKFASVYGKPLSEACSNAAATSLPMVISAEKTYNDAKTALGSTPTAADLAAVDKAAEDFFNQTIKYVEDGGSAILFDASFGKAYDNVLNQHAVTKKTASTCTALKTQLDTIQGYVEQIFGPKPSGTSTANFVKSLQRQVSGAQTSLAAKFNSAPFTVIPAASGIPDRYLEISGVRQLQGWIDRAISAAGPATGTTTAPVTPSWKDVQFDDLDTAFSSTDGIMGAVDAYKVTGFSYLAPTATANSLATQVRNAITQAYTNGNDHGTAHVSAGGAGGPTPAQQDILNDADGLRTYLSTAPIPTEWTGFTNDATQTLVSNVTNLVTQIYTNGSASAVSPDAWKQTQFDNLDTYFKTESTAGGSLAAFGYNSPDGSNPSLDPNALQKEVVKMMGRVEARGKASVASAPSTTTPGNVKAAIMASIATLQEAVTDHNAQINDLKLVELEAMYKNNAGTGTQELTLFGDKYQTVATQTGALKKITKPMNLLLTTLYKAGSNLRKLQASLYQEAGAAGVSPSFTTIKAIHATGADGTPPLLTAPTGLSLTDAVYNVEVTDYPLPS